MKRSFTILVFSLLLLMMLAPVSFSQTSGKISGSVIDVDTGDPLPGANVIIVGTNRGAAADMQGEFFMINVPPGAYNIEARVMGYTSMQIEDVRIFVNRTTPLEFKLKAAVIEGEVVVVKADKITVKKDQTSSIRHISSEDIELLPAESVGEVVSMQPGVVGSHFRGGRSNEVTYLIDGVAVTDAFNHTSKTSEVNPEVVEDVEVITGTFNAEYGDAMSGVVNVVTKEGSNRIDGSASINFGNYVTPHDNRFPGLNDSEFDRIQDFKIALSGPVIKNKLFFVANARFNKNLGHLTAKRLFNVDDFSDFTSQYKEQWWVESTGDSAIVPMNWNESYSAFGKLTFKPFRSLKVSLSATWNKGDGQNYSHSSKFRPDGVPSWHNKTTMGTLHINHMLSRSAFHDLKISYSDYWTGWYVYKNPLDSRYVHDEYNRSNGSWFVTGGQDKGHTNRYEKKVEVNWDFNWQINKNHSIKTGIDFNRIELDNQWHSIRNKFEGSGIEHEFHYEWDDMEVIDSTTFYVEGLQRVYDNYEPTIHDNMSTHTDAYVKWPTQAAWYIQDKMEFNMMVVNIGLRLDYFDPKTVYPSQRRNPGNQIQTEITERISEYPDADAKTQLSPRLGLSYSLGETALLRFAYGHFLQLPPLNYFYQNSTFLLSAGGDYSTVMGNAQLNPQKTIQYEVGLFQQLTNEMSLEVAVWYKDIYDLVTATIFTTYNQKRYGVFTNKEYGNARGLEIKYDYRKGSFSAGANYTFGYTKGVADNPRSTFNRAGTNQDPVNKLIPMNWDQRHTLNLYAGFNTTNYGTTLMWYLNSGQPYTWNAIPQSPLSAINLFPNNQYRPARYSVDLNAFYNLAKFKGINFRLTVLVYNLLDRLNENWVNSETGRAYTAVVQETDILGHRSTFSTYEDVYKNPSMYSAPRMIKVGLGVTF